MINGVATTSKDNQLVRGFEYNPSLGLEKMKEVAQEIIDSGLCPANLNQPGQLLAVAEMGRSLGISWMTAINNIDNIQGKPTLSYRLVSALVNKAGYLVNLTKDFEPQYDAAGTIIDYVTEMEITDLNLVEKVNKELERLVALPEDVRKVSLGLLDKYKDLLSRKFRFTYTQARSAGLLDKRNYIERPIEMFRARCMTGMVRLYCAQIMMGFYETSEIHHDIVPETTGDASFTSYEEV